MIIVHIVILLIKEFLLIINVFVIQQMVFRILELFNVIILIVDMDVQIVFIHPQDIVAILVWEVKHKEKMMP